MPIESQGGGLVDARADRWKNALERAHDLSHRAALALAAAPRSTNDLAPAAETLARAVTAIVAAADGREDRLTSTRRAMLELDAARSAIEVLEDPAESLAEAVGYASAARMQLGLVDERLSRLPPDAPPAATLLRASGELPTLHRLERPSLTPIFRVADPLPKPPDASALLARRATSLEDLDDAVDEVSRRAAARQAAREAKEQERKRLLAMPREQEITPPGFVHGTIRAVTEADWIKSRARELFDEISMIGVQRMPILGESWRQAIALERRLLAAVDGLAALGPRALALIEAFVVDAPAKDPARGFAFTIIFGSIDGRDAFGAVERVIRHLGPSDPDVFTAASAALRVVPHPAVAMALRSWLGDPEPACRALALEVLAARGAATVDELAIGARDPSPEVAAIALPALGLARGVELWTAAERALGVADPVLCEAAWRGLALAGHLRAADLVASELRGPMGGRAAMALALVADDRDAAALVSLAQKEPTVAVVTSLGWAGATEAVPLLIDLLGHADPDVQAAAASALERITGARLLDQVEVPAEIIAAPDVDASEPDVGEPKPPPLARVVGDARDLPGEGASETIQKPTLDPGRWRLFWANRSADVRPGLRYRRGRPYVPTVSLFELDALPLSPLERRQLHRELIVRTGQASRFDPGDFVRVQEESLRAWAPLAERASASPGTWSRPVRR